MIAVRRAPFAVRLVGAGLHAFLLASPVLVCAPDRITDPRLLTFIGLLVLWSGVEATAQPSRGAESASPLTCIHGLALALAFFSGPIGFCIDPALTPSAGAWVSGACGAVGMVLGMVLRHASIRALGAWFQNEVIIREGHGIFSRGIYAQLRHPSEVGTLCLAFGGAALLHSTTMLACSLGLVLPATIFRIRREDAALAAAHPVAFAQYRRNVGSLLPSLARW